MKEPGGGELTSDAILLTLGSEPPPHDCDERCNFFEFRAKLWKTEQFVFNPFERKRVFHLHCIIQN